MVCSFFYRTIPVLFVMVIYWIYCKITGKDQEPQPDEVEELKKELQEVNTEPVTSGCPYHVFMAAIGYPVHKKKNTEVDSNDKSTNLDKSVKVE